MRRTLPGAPYPLGAVWDEKGVNFALYSEGATGAPRAVVIDPTYDWEGDASPKVPLHQMVIYEAHVRGLERIDKRLKRR